MQSDAQRRLMYKTVHELLTQLDGSGPISLLPYQSTETKTVAQQFAHLYIIEGPLAKQLHFLSNLDRHDRNLVLGQLSCR